MCRNICRPGQCVKVTFVMSKVWDRESELWSLMVQFSSLFLHKINTFKSKDEYQMHLFNTQLTYFKVCKDVDVEDDHLKIPSVFFGVSDSRPKLDPSSLTESYKWKHPAVGMAVPCLKHAQEQGFSSHWLNFKWPSGMQNLSQMCWADQSRQNSLDCSLTHHWICWIFYWGVIGNVSLNTVINKK